MKPVVLLPRAEVDLFDAAIWYENEREGLGPAFEADFDRLVSRIEWSPFQFPEIDPGIRRAMLSRFPFGIYFAIEPRRSSRLRRPSSASRSADLAGAQQIGLSLRGALSNRTLQQTKARRAPPEARREFGDRVYARRAAAGLRS